MCVCFALEVSHKNCSGGIRAEPKKSILEPNGVHNRAVLLKLFVQGCFGSNSKRFRENINTFCRGVENVKECVWRDCKTCLGAHVLQECSCLDIIVGSRRPIDFASKSKSEAPIGIC